MKRFFPLCCVAIFCGIFLSIRPADAQEFKTTPAKIIAESPQRFWARGVVFRDVLTEPVDTKHKIKIGERTAYRFVTRTIGDIYADEAILNAIEKLEIGHEYIFTASVHSTRTGLFKKKTHYRVVVNGLAIPAQELGALTDEVEAALARQAGGHPLLQQLDLLKQLIERSQESITALAATEQTNRAAYFDPNSESFSKLIQITRRSLSDLGTESKVPDRELFAQILAALIALKEGALTPPAPQVAPDVAPEEMSEEPTVESAPDATEAPPARRHFWQRKQEPKAPDMPPAIGEEQSDSEAAAEEVAAPQKTRKKKAAKAKKEPTAESQAPAELEPESIQLPVEDSIPEPTAIEPALGSEPESVELDAPAHAPEDDAQEAHDLELEQDAP